MRLLGGVYYGWVMLLALCLHAGDVVGHPLLRLLGLPQADRRRSRLVARGDDGGILARARSCSGVAGLFVGRWLDRHGPRLLMTAGSCAAALLLLALGGGAQSRRSST